MIYIKTYPARLLFIIFVVFYCAFGAAAQKPIRDLKSTVVLISLDGFRPDYLDRFKPKTMLKLAREGVRAEWMIPSYPTKTYPNHYTIANGLYPDHHGIIENNMYDEKIGAEFHLDDKKQVENPAWWGGEPIWVTAEKQGQFSVGYFYPGTQTAIKGVLPTFYRKYDGSVSNTTRVDELLAGFDLPVEKRPTMFTLYFSDTDDIGHKYSPDAPEIKSTVLKVDGDIRHLIDGLRGRKIDKKVNIILVSDHGMATVKPQNLILLDTMFNPADAERIFWVDEFVQIFPKPGKEDSIYQAIKSKLPAAAHIYRPRDFPEKYHFGTNPRIAPLVVAPDTGYKVISQAKYVEMKSKNEIEGNKGAHGYDNFDPAMRSLFVARGEAFRRKYRAAPFSNVEV